MTLFPPPLVVRRVLPGSCHGHNVDLVILVISQVLAISISPKVICDGGKVQCSDRMTSN